MPEHRSPWDPETWGAVCAALWGAAYLGWWVLVVWSVLSWWISR